MKNKCAGQNTHYISDMDTVVKSCVILIISAMTVAIMGNGSGEMTGSGPIFILQPSSLVQFMNDHRTIVDCIVHGNPPPKVTWMNVGNGHGDSDQPVRDVPGLLTILSNNSLSFHPFRADQYDQKVHSSGYRCQATNTYGSIISQVTTVKAVVDQEYRTQVYDEYVILGNTAVLKCNIPSYISDYVQVISWMINEDVRISSNYQQDNKYGIQMNGDLHIRNVDNRDSQSVYKCETRHTITMNTKISDNSGRLYVTEPSSGVSPRILDPISSMTVQKGEKIEIPCVVQGFPNPKLSWCFKKENSHCSPLDDKGLSKGDFIFTTSSLVLVTAKPENQGRYTCSAKNNIGQAHSTTKLIVIVPLTVFLHPQRQLVDSGQPIFMTCVVSGSPIRSLTWFRNGKVLKRIDAHQGKNLRKDDFVLNFTSASRSTSGMFQCFVSNGFTTKQAIGEVILTSSAPVITSSFESEIVQPGRSIELECSSVGVPPPRITWSLAEQDIIPDQLRIRIDEATVGNMVNSKLIVNGVKSFDGGQYSCIASNKAGKVFHSGNIYVYGRPQVRMLRNKTILSGDDLVLHCHVYGYPIGNIRWSKNGKNLKPSEKVLMSDNGTLEIFQAESKTHSGKYTCTAHNKQGTLSSNNHGWVKIIAKPVLVKLNRRQVLQVGERITLLCTVRSGDPPIEFAWKLNGKDIPYEMRATITDTADSSALKFGKVDQSNSGNYSCEARNAAGSVKEYTIIQVEGPPRWKNKPVTKLGSSERKRYWIDCSADAYPRPFVEWYRTTYGDKEKMRNTSNILIYPNGTLMVKSLSVGINEKYTCRVSNGIEPDLKETIQILFGNKPIITNPVHRTTMLIGQPLKLACSADGSGPLTVKWMKQNIYIRPGDNSRIIIKTNGSKSRIRSELTIEKANPADSGNYECQVSNKYGSDILNTVIVNRGRLVNGGKNIGPNVVTTTSPVPWSSANVTARDEENDEWFGVALLYVIPTTTAAIVLFIVLIIVCILLKRQTRRDSLSSSRDTDYDSLRRLKMLEQSSETVKYDGTLQKSDGRDQRYYQLGKFQRTGSDDIYTSPTDGSNIQPYATFTASNTQKKDFGTLPIELQNLN
ncbi:Uncharacterised protein at_DN2487 [Pycnogonum litorale]